MAELHPNDIELLEYFEGEADPTTMETIRRHVETCGECSELVTLLAAGRGALTSSPELEMSRERIAQTLDSLGPQEPRPKPQWLRPRRLVAILAPVAAVVALVAIISTVDLGSSSDDTAAPTPAEAPADDQAFEADEASQLDGEAATEAPGEPTATPESQLEAAPDSAGDLGAGIAEESPMPAAPAEAPAPAPPPAPAEEPARAADMPPAEAAPPPAALGEIVRSVRGPARNVARLLREAGFSASVSALRTVEVASSDDAAVNTALAGLADGRVEVVLVGP